MSAQSWYWRYSGRQAGSRTWSDIANWLDSIGLRKYADVFEANEIDLDAAWHLTEQDLVEIGLPLGPRRKSWPAILSHNRPWINRSVGPGTGETSERRHITVHICRYCRLDRTLREA